MSRSRRLLVALFALLGVATAIVAVTVWERSRPVVIDLENRVEALALSADGSSLAAFGNDFSWLYTREHGVQPVPRAEESLTGDSWVRTKLVFSPKDDNLYGVWKRGEVRAWSLRDVATIKLPPLEIEGRCIDAVLSPRGDLVATRSDRGVLQLRELPSLKPVRTVVEDPDLGLAVTLGFSPSGELVFVENSFANTLRAWSVADGRLVVKGGHRRWLMTVLDPGERYVDFWISGNVFLDGFHTIEPLYEVAGSNHDPALAVSRDGELLAVGRKGVELHSLRDRELVRVFDEKAGESCTALAFSGDGERLAAAFGRRVHVWRLRR